jgi:hypothetical protein
MSEQVIVELIKQGLSQHGGNLNRIAQRIEAEVIAPIRSSPPGEPGRAAPSSRILTIMTVFIQSNFTGCFG